MYYNKVRAVVAPYVKDRYFAPDIAVIKQAIYDGEFVLSALTMETVG